MNKKPFSKFVNFTNDLRISMKICTASIRRFNTVYRDVDNDNKGIS